jgi:hypothetical protein
MATAGQTAFQIAQRKARYGHKSYLVWTDRSGEQQYALYNKANIKRAILDVGTKGRFYWLSASTGVSNIARSFSYMLHLLKCAPGAAA